jgi:simple sugar transport system permease protein
VFKLVKRVNISKRKKMSIRIIAILLALVTASIFILILGHNPFKVYSTMISGALGSAYRRKDTLTIAIPLIITSLGIMVAFKMKFWNIGAEGQILMGAFTASFVALNFSHLPKPIVIILMIIAGIIGGGLWALIPALLKVNFDTNETIITLMLNYIAIKWITYLQFGPWKDPNSLGFPEIAPFEKSALLPKVFGIHIGWIIAIVLAIVLYIFLNHSKKGYEISVVGESVDTAKYAGMNVKKIIVMSLFISGGICGLVGMIQASGVNRTLSMDVSSGYGYTAIITTWLSGLKTSTIIPVSLLFATMIKGGSYIQTAYQIPHSVSDVLQSMILFFVLGSELFINYKIVLKKSLVKEEC